MEWIDKMNKALDYIEDNLEGEINLSTVAQKACCSSYNFQRMFSFITDVSLAEYIRRRRLTQAALELQNSNIKIVDLAIKYGYDSPVSFSRAFQLLHGMTPTQARQLGVILKAYSRISFQISIKGETEMKYRIEEKGKFDIFGIEILVSPMDGANAITPAQLWQQCHSNGSYEKLFEDIGELPDFLSKDLCRIHGAVNYKATDENTYPYMLCGFVGSGSNIKDYKIVHVPAQTYAIFPSEPFSWDEDFGKVLTNLQKRFYSEWLPTANYEKVEAAEFEIYGGTSEYGYIELWYPIRKR